MKFRNFVLVICVSSLCASCGQAEGPFDLAQYEIDTLQWRAERVQNLKVETVIEGLGWQPESPGVVVFELQDQEYQLEAYASGDELTVHSIPDANH